MKNEKKKISPASVPMFSGDLSFMGCPRIDCMGELPSGSIVVLGIPFDVSTSNRPGARFGPRAIRIATKMISWQKLYPWEDDLYGVGPTPKNCVFDAGDVPIDFGYTDSIKSVIQKAVLNITHNQATPLILGGDHFISYPVLQALVKGRKLNSLALVHFDAHCDTWSDEADRVDHGTGFYHAIQEGIIDKNHSLQIGLRTHSEKDWGIESIDVFEAHTLSANAIVDRIKSRVKNLPAYLTFDIDVLDPAYAPGTGTPVIGGLTTIQVIEILRKLKEINWIGADIVEVSPPYDHGEITALAGATIAGYLGHLLINTES